MVNILKHLLFQSRIGLYPRPESVGNLKHNPICYTSNNSTPTSNVFDYPCATTLSGRFVTLQKLTEGFWHVVEVSINIA